MKKLITLSLIALFAVGNLMAFDMNWNGEARVRGGLVMNDNFSDKSATSTWKAQRIRLFWTGEADNGVKFVVRSHLSNGDVSVYNTAKKSDGTVFALKSVSGSYGSTIDLDRAYIVVPDAFLGVTVTAGLMPAYATNGLVVDDNLPGIYFGKGMGDISVGVGSYSAFDRSYFTEYTNNTTTTQAAGYQGATSADDDSRYWMANFSMNNAGPGTVGLDVLAKTNATTDADHKKANYFWISPWYSMSAGDFSVNVNPVILTGGYDKREAAASTVKNVSGTVVAVIVKPSFTLAATGTSLAGDFLYVTGNKTTDTDKLGWKNISSFYCSGLEFFGSANEIDHYGDIGNGAGASGQMSLIVKADQPLTSALALHAAAGYVALAEKNADGKTDLGTEIDLGLRWAVKENVTWKFTAAYVMPGKASSLTNDDALTSLTSYLGYSF